MIFRIALLFQILFPFQLIRYAIKLRKFVRCLIGMIWIAIAILYIGIEKPFWFIVIVLTAGLFANVKIISIVFMAFRDDNPPTDEEWLGTHFLGTLAFAFWIMAVL